MCGRGRSRVGVDRAAQAQLRALESKYDQRAVDFVKAEKDTREESEVLARQYREQAEEALRELALVRGLTLSPWRCQRRQPHAPC